MRKIERAINFACGAVTGAQVRHTYRAAKRMDSIRVLCLLLDTGPDRWVPYRCRR